MVVVKNKNLRAMKIAIENGSEWRSDCLYILKFENNSWKMLIAINKTPIFAEKHFYCTLIRPNNCVR